MNELREKINEIVTLVSVFKKGKVTPDPADAILDAVIAALPVSDEYNVSRGIDKCKAVLRQAKENK